MSPPGTYALLLYLNRSHTVPVGALGQKIFPQGWYLYVGSARGPGGLAARLARHRRSANKRLHWHIDYLRTVAPLAEIWSIRGETRRECAWATAAATLPDAQIPALGFGASDCRCDSHLFHYPQEPPFERFKTVLKAKLERECIADR